MKNQSRDFILLDRDGTINIEHHYLSDPDQLKLFPDTGKALYRLKVMGFGLIVITNQSGVYLGYLNLAKIRNIHNRLQSLLKNEGVYLDDIYFCPHGSKENCTCRKPRTGMIDQAVAEHKFDPHRSFMIGDKAVDIDLGNAVGATSILLRTGWGIKTEREGKCVPSVIVNNLTDAVNWIEQRYEKLYE
ncbi:MAG: HAD family hydrolase [Rhodospirillaceae bacterium]|nr:HAD family hydrolase [Rhodospirillaceae bacterium]